MDCEVFHNDGRILLRNPLKDLEFHLEHGIYVTRNRFRKGDTLYVSEAHLGAKHYNVVDQGFDIKSGRQLWGLPDGEFYEFRK